MKVKQGNAPLLPSSSCAYCAGFHSPIKWRWDPWHYWNRDLPSGERQQKRPKTSIRLHVLLFFLVSFCIYSQWIVVCNFSIKHIPPFHPFNSTPFSRPTTSAAEETGSGETASSSEFVCRVFSFSRAAANSLARARPGAGFTRSTRINCATRRVKVTHFSFIYLGLSFPFAPCSIYYYHYLAHYYNYNSMAYSRLVSIHFPLAPSFAQI